MQGKLKQRYQILKEVSRGSYFQGQIEVEKLSRLSELLASDSGEIALEFEFKNSDFGIPMISGKIQTRLQVECQRCLQAMETDLAFDFKLLVDADDDIIQKAFEEDWILITNDKDFGEKVYRDGRFHKDIIFF